jgi:ABC-type multidrug transport system fused ATPase/permease subunit
VKVRLTRGVTLLALLIAAVAVGLLYWSWDSQTSTWESAVLVGFGSALLLFVPLAILTRGIETALDRVSTRQEQISTRQEETASDVAQLAEEVAQTQADLRLTREQLSEVVREQITENKSKDSVLFKAVGEAPSQADVLNSLVRAKEMGIISDQGCRVDLISDCYLRFKPEWRSDDPDDIGANRESVIELTLERIDATALRSVDWYAGSSPSEIAVSVAQLMQASGVYSGDNLFDAGKIFAGLSALLNVGHDSITSGAISPVRHIIQLCPPQWAVCDDGIYCTQRSYTLAANRMNEPRLLADMNEKTWADMNSFEEASNACRALFESGRLAVKPRGSDLPLF